METEWARAKQANLKVSVKVELDYRGSSFRPDSIQVEYTIEGRPKMFVTFKN